MQYILTQEELDKLRADQGAVFNEKTADLEKLCKLAAVHVPVARPWSPGSPPAPWGCIHVPEKNPGYCDDCPAQKVCTMPKRFSK